MIVVKEYDEKSRAELLALVDRALELTVDHLALELVRDAAFNAASEVVMRNMLRSHYFSFGLARDRLMKLRASVVSGLSMHHELPSKASKVP